MVGSTTPMTNNDHGQQTRLGKRFAPLRQRSAVDQTVDKLLTAVALGEFGPGDRMPSERDLAAQLQVARETVRQAISRLSGLGVVEVRRGRVGGAYVCGTWTKDVAAAVHRTLNTDWPQLKLLLDLRSLVEGLVASTAAERLTKSHSRRITEALSAHAVAKTPKEVRSSDREFHRAIAEATRNRYLLDLRDDLAAAVGVHFGSEPYVEDPAVTRRATRQHQELATAILNRDAHRASEVARRHFRINLEAVETLRARAASEVGRAERDGHE
jgi:GntR family transcriptional repressor for pyruvate dehydrogenase complex